MSDRLLLATRNPGKLAELQRLLESAVPGVAVVGLRDVPEYPEAPETGATFAENALLKARHAAAGSGLIALADDSGLEVDGLGGAPGVHSARYAGEGADDEANRERLRRDLLSLPEGARTGRFRCAIAIAVPAGAVEVVEGVCEGVLVTEPRGSGGFGYDPLFLLPERGLTMAQLSLEEKGAISHRARALERALPILHRRLAESAGVTARDQPARSGERR